MSIQPPPDAKLHEHPGGDILLHMALPENATISLSIRRSAIQMSIDQLVVEAIHQLASKHPSAVILDQRQTQFANRPAAVVYFSIPSGRLGPWILGQAYTQLDPHVFVVLRSEIVKAAYPQARPVFEAVAQSLAVRDPREIAQHRLDQVSRGESWIQSVTPEQLHDAIVPESWHRILAAGKDVGYMRITQAPSEQLGRPGIGVSVQSRIVVAGRTTDALSDVFLSDDGHHEIWSIRSTTRRHDPTRKNPNPAQRARPNHSWAETGVRAYDRITVNRQTPTGIDKNQWSTPPHGYLSQVRLLMANQTLPRHVMGNAPGTEIDMGFYAYDPSTAKLAFRTLRVAKTMDGTINIHTRPSPTQGETVSRLDTKAKLINRTLPGGQILQPTTKQHIAALWKLR